MENRINDGQHRHGQPTPRVRCLFCKLEATIPIKCSCGYIRCRVCHAHKDISHTQGFIDSEFGCRNPTCPKCDHEYVESKELLKQLLKAAHGE